MKSNKVDKEGLTHSMVEKRRRERIKTCVQQLKMLVPESRKKKTIQKLYILENAVRYIKQQNERWEKCKCPFNSDPALEDQENISTYSGGSDIDMYDDDNSASPAYSHLEIVTRQRANSDSTISSSSNPIISSLIPTPSTISPHDTSLTHTITSAQLSPALESPVPSDKPMSIKNLLH
ncbi:hypothetical protein HDV02_002861 [Globomyces sp. JEL0801]|nr:hypothetical protein HDV02_002861 [Globomyces sp. JEL0801]